MSEYDSITATTCLTCEKVFETANGWNTSVVYCHECVDAGRHIEAVDLTKSPVYRAWSRIAKTEDCRPFWQFSEVTKRFPSSLPQNALRFDNISDMKRQVNASGSHFYDADAIRWFKGKTDPTMIDGRFWVESTKDGDRPRRYQVTWAYRETAESGASRISIERLGYYPTLEAARSARRMLAEACKAER